VSRELEPVVPDALRARLTRDPGAPEVAGFTLLLLTVRDDGWPHQAMLSAGEVAADPADPAAVRLAVWPGSTSTRNLAARGRATLTAVADGVAYALRLAVASAGEIEAAGARLAAFHGRVDAATADEAPYARLRDGVRFELVDEAATIARWRAVRAALAEVA
jgi:hypothetical protein